MSKVAEEEITDLTAEENGADTAAKGKEKKPKREKKPKKSKDAPADQEQQGDQASQADENKSKPAKKEKRAKKPKSPTDKSEKMSGGAGLILVMLVTALLLIGSFGAVLYFDIFDARTAMSDLVRDPLLDFLVWLDPSFSSVNDELLDEAKARENELEKRESAVAKREEEVEGREERANTREIQLNRRAAELNDLEDRLNQQYDREVPLHRRDLTQEELDDLLSLSVTFTRMAPADAATILAELHTLQDVASILYYMSERQRAPILEAFDTEYAASVVDFLLYN